MIKNVLIGFAVAFVAGLGLGFLDSVAGSSSETTFIVPVVLGILIFFILQMRSGNRKEVRVDAASQQSLLATPAPTGQALLYVYREGFMGKAVGWNILLDGSALAQLRSPRFTQTVLDPGSHTLAVTLGGFAGTQNKPAEVTFQVEAGEVIVIAVKSKMGALSNTLFFVREQDAPATLQKLSKMPMVAAQRAAGIVAA